jgi:hypothetical protein
MLDRLLLPLLTGVLTGTAGILLEGARQWYVARQKLRAADEKHFRTALTSDSQAELGGYLDENIGEFSVREYAENAKVRERVNAFLARLEEFVGKSAEIPPEPPTPEPHTSGVEFADPALQNVGVRINQGAIWDALSALRRVIEVRLRTLSGRTDIEIAPRAGAGRVLRLLEQRQIVPSDAARNLKYAIDVANRGVHGLDVSPDEALEALQEAINGLLKLDLVEHGQRRS